MKKKMNWVSVSYGTTLVVYDRCVIRVPERGWGRQIFEEMAASYFIVLMNCNLLHHSFCWAFRLVPVLYPYK